MIPYYQDSAVTIYHGDCREILPTLSGVTVTFTSPPYNQNLQSFAPSGMHKESKWCERIATSYHDTMPEAEYQEWQIDILNLAYNCASKDGSIFYNHKLRYRDTVPIFPTEWVTRSKWIMRQEIIWARDGSVTQNARMFPPSDERIYWMRKDSWQWNRADSSWFSVWNIPSASGTDHPVAFPIELPKRAIACCSSPGDTVLDPFMGSGTTLRAAKDLGRKAIGIEIEERYCEIAAKRMTQEVMPI